MIPYGKQHITKDDIKAVKDVLNSDFLTQGPCVEKFENSITDHTKSKYGVACNSATSALHIACMAMGVSKNDIVWTSSNTFVASANCALYCGASVDFVDIDPNSFLISIEKLKEKLLKAKNENKLPKVLIPVHLCGQSCDMERIHELSKEYGFGVIEDASHAIGAFYKNMPVGSCIYSDICVFSFHPVKIITTGEGGIAVTNDIDISQKMSLYRSHGITRDRLKMREPNGGGWYYEQLELGYNYRMTDIHAALGLSQMNRLGAYIKKRHEIAKIYDEELSQLPIKLPLQNEDSFSSFHLYVIRLELKKIKMSHENVFNTLRENGIGVNLHYIPVHLHPFYKNLGFKDGDYPESEKYSSEAISIPIHHSLTRKDQNYVIKILKKILK